MSYATMYDTLDDNSDTGDRANAEAYKLVLNRSEDDAWPETDGAEVEIIDRFCWMYSIGVMPDGSLVRVFDFLGFNQAAADQNRIRKP